jgi:hypothetical protein
MRRFALPAALALAAAAPPPPRARPVRVIGPLRNLELELGRAVYQLRRDRDSIHTVAEILRSELADRGLEPGCHVRRTAEDPEVLPGTERAHEWFAGQLVHIFDSGERGDLVGALTGLQRWIRQVGDTYPERKPPGSIVVQVTPDQVAELDLDDVRKLAAAEEKRERRAVKRRKP